MNTLEAAKILTSLRKLLELEGENKFKLRALELAEENLKSTEIELIEFISLVESKQVSGIGTQLLKDLKEIENTKTLKAYQNLKNVYTDSIFELFKIRGLGASKIKTLFDNLQVNSIEKLKLAIAEKTIHNLKGFGDKSIASIEENINFLETWKGYFCIDVHEIAIDNIISKLGPFVQTSGTSKTKEEVFNKIELEAEENKRDEILIHLKEKLFKEKFEAEDKELITFNFKDLPVELRFVKKLDALATSDNQKLVGILHTHTTYSDGQHSIEEMANACISKGYSYLGITDHSKTAAYAGGLSEDKLKLQGLEIDELNEKLKPFKILKGIESDILNDGELDYPDKVLEKLDFVIASIHSGFNISKKQMTERITKAIKNPFTSILGHPTGRLLLKRPEYEVYMEEVINTAIEYNKIIELNSNPKRLDISWNWLKKYKDSPLKIVITPDAHSISQIDYVKYGQLLAEKAQFSNDKIVNYGSLNDFLKNVNEN